MQSAGCEGEEQFMQQHKVALIFKTSLYVKVTGYVFNFIAQITKLAITQILTLYTPAWISEVLNRYYKNAITKIVRKQQPTYCRSVYTIHKSTARWALNRYENTNK